MKVKKSNTAQESKAERIAKKREKNQRIATMFKGGDEPCTDVMNYQWSLVKCLNYYNINSDSKDHKKWITEYLTAMGRKKDLVFISDATDIELKTIGVLFRLISRDQYIDSSDVEKIDQRIIEIRSRAKPEPQQIVQQQIKKPKDDTLSEFFEPFEDAIDQFVKSKKIDIDPSAILKGKQVSGTISKKIAGYYSEMIQELKESQSDSYLAEAYSNFTKTQMKKLIAFIESIVAACSQQVVSVKAPRKKKPVPVTKQVAKVQYLKEYDELKLKSVKPEAMVDSTEIWLYNTKYKKVTVLKALKGQKLSVKGSTVLGFDVAESKNRMLRKPEEFFKTPIAKRALGTAFNALKTKEQEANGRINKDTIIFGVF